MTERSYADSHKGQRRANNQDVSLARDLDDGLTLLIVADGVGGANGGEIASAETASAISGFVVANPQLEPADRLRSAVVLANDRVRARAKADLALNGMASTLVGALVGHGLAWIVNVGDSRAYLCVDSTSRALTEDDSWVAEQVRSGALSAEDAAKSPYQNVVTKGIGVEDVLTFDIEETPLSEGDVLLLCSDGLYRVVTPETMAATVRGTALKDAGRRLIELANRAGGPDNVSVALYREPGD